MSNQTVECERAREAAMWEMFCEPNQLAKKGCTMYVSHEVAKHMVHAVGIEISGCEISQPVHGDFVYEAIPCESPDAEIHSVYSQHEDGSAYVLEDFDTYGEARAYAEHLSAEYNLEIWERR